jgi:hypothetical protein
MPLVNQPLDGTGRCVWERVYAWQLFSYTPKRRNAMSKKTLPTVRVLSTTEGRALFDQRSREELGIPGAKFVRLWKKGKYAKRSCEPKVLRVAMLLPLAR